MNSRPTRDLGLVVAVLCVATRLVDGPALWAATALTVATAVAGAIHVLGTWHPRRIRYERLVLPAFAAFAAVGVARLFDASGWGTLAAVAVAAAAWAGVAWVVALETAPAPPDRLAVRSATLALAFLCLTAVGGIVPAGLAGDRQPLEPVALVAVVLLDAAVGGLAGLRLWSLEAGLSWRRLLLEAGCCLALAALAGAVVRVVEIPRILGPALVTAALYVWVEWRQAPASLRENATLRRDMAGLGLAALAALTLGILAR